MNQPITSKPSSNSPQNSQSDSNGKQSFQISAPSISLPKGGGAIRGMGEKFAANPVTGTGSMTRADRDQPRPLRLRTATFAFLRLRRGQWTVWFWLESFASFNHAQDRQGTAQVSRRR